MEVSGALLGVRTRSRTLALQRTHSGKGEEEPSAGDYLELRNRRLEKPPPPPRKEKEASAAVRRAAAAAGRKEAAEPADLEPSFGDNVLDWDAVERYGQDSPHPLSVNRCCSSVNSFCCQREDWGLGFISHLHCVYRGQRSGLGLRVELGLRGEVRKGLPPSSFR